jgi:AcrR family transcriptional regulator
MRDAAAHIRFSQVFPNRAGTGSRRFDFRPGAIGKSGMSVLDKTTDDPKPVRRKPESRAKIKKAARKLFVERGYHATRPQDIAREAGLGHGTFYLHYPDKRACFLAFVEDARTELDQHVRARIGSHRSLEELIAATLRAIYEYSQSHPGVLNAAMTDEAVIDAEGVQAVPLLQRWGRAWAETVRAAAGHGQVCDLYDPDIVGQAILGAIHQTASEGYRSGRSQAEVVRNLTLFLVRALKP